MFIILFSFATELIDWSTARMAPDETNPHPLGTRGHEQYLAECQSDQRYRYRPLRSPVFKVYAVTLDAADRY